MSGTNDHILAVLRDCEEKLRTLATDGRLSGNALGAFADLASRIRQEIERRRSGDRRESARLTPDRRLTHDDSLEPATAGDWRRRRPD